MHQNERRSLGCRLLAGVIASCTGLLLPVAPATGTESDTVDALRAELAALREEYEARIAALESRLAQLEGATAARPSAELERLRRAALDAAAQEPTTAAPATVPVGIPEGPTVGRERNLNRLNPEISVTGIVLANASDRDREEFEAQEFELDLQAALDPFSRTRVTLALREGEVEIEEGYLTYSSLPGGLELMAGRFRERFGKLNRQHRHALPQSDYPLVIQTFFGEEGLAQTGLSFGWLLPRLWASANEITFEVTNGENETAFGGELFDDFSFLGHVQSFWDLSPAAYFEWGLSGIVGKTFENGTSRVWGTDITYQWRPPARAKYRGITWRTELLLSQRDDELGELQQAWGGYTYIEGLVVRNLYLGLRGDRTEDPLVSEEYRWGLVPYLTWWQSEYVRLRAEYGYLEDPALDETENRFTLQLTWAAGPHKHSTY
jgi:hypothetical protein